MSIYSGGQQHYDPKQTGLPLWAQRDQGPTHTYVPGPLPNTPLRNTYAWHVRAAIWGVIFGIVIALVLIQGQAGSVTAAILLLLLYLLIVGPAWARSRAGLTVDGDRAEVRSWRGTRTFTASQVVRVQYVYQGRSPDVRLRLDDGTSVLVATSRLDKGHSTLFEWLRQFAPQAEYDSKALDLRDTLVNRGLIGDPDGSAPEAGPGAAATDSSAIEGAGDFPPPVGPPASGSNVQSPAGPPPAAPHAGPSFEAPPAASPAGPGRPDFAPPPAAPVPTAAPPAASPATPSGRPQFTPPTAPHVAQSAPPPAPAPPPPAPSAPPVAPSAAAAAPTPPPAAPVTQSAPPPVAAPAPAPPAPSAPPVVQSAPPAAATPTPSSPPPAAPRTFDPELDAPVHGIPPRGRPTDPSEPPPEHPYFWRSESSPPVEPATPPPAADTDADGSPEQDRLS